MDLINLLILSAIFSILPGQLIRISLGSLGAVTLTDIFVGLCDTTFLLFWLTFKKSLKLPAKITYFFTLFTIWSLASTILAANFFSSFEIAVALSFLFRFTAYFFFAIVISNISQKSSQVDWVNGLLFVGALFVIIGFLQILIFPDLSFLASFGWDPHKTRIVSTLLDPNFTGGLTTVFFSLAISLFIFNKKLIHAILAAIFFAAIILTFSRSAYLAFLTSISIIGLVKSPKVLIVSLLLFVISTATIPQVRHRIVGALTLDETATARIESWQKALRIFAQNPIFGVGFNTYRFAQIKYGNFNFDSPKGGHSGAGSDSSILLVVATTGIFGLLLYVGLLFSLFQVFLENFRKSYLNLAATASFSGLIVHSQFVNSLFFPQIMLVLFFITGLTLCQKK